MRLPTKASSVRHLLTVIVVGVLAGCGGGGGGGGFSGNPPTTATTLGSRALPGCEVAVERASSSSPGTWTFQVRLSPSTQVLDSLGVRLGTDYASDGYAAATIVAGEPGVYAITVTQPATIAPGQRVWVRLALADGTILESGGDDFAL